MSHHISLHTTRATGSRTETLKPETLHPKTANHAPKNLNPKTLTLKPQTPKPKPQNSIMMTTTLPRPRIPDQPLIRS